MTHVQVAALFGLVVATLMAIGWAKASSRASMFAYFIRKTEQQEKFAHFVMGQRSDEFKNKVYAKYFSDMD